MDFRDLMKVKYAYLSKVEEPEVNTVKLLISKANLSSTPEKLLLGGKELESTFPITVDEDLPTIELYFDSYIGYSVTNESFTVMDDYELFEGAAFRIYSKSRYLDYISKSTIATEDYPGTYKHYSIACLDHIIDIVSVDKPVVREYRR